MGGFSWLGQSSEEQIAIYNALIQEGIKIVPPIEPREGTEVAGFFP